MTFKIQNVAEQSLTHPNSAQLSRWDALRLIGMILHNLIRYRIQALYVASAGVISPERYGAGGGTMMVAPAIGGNGRQSRQCYGCAQSWQKDKNGYHIGPGGGMAACLADQPTGEP